jgi:hypothetical protein
MIRIFAGYDPREAIGYHVFCQSLIERSTDGVAITPLFGKQRDGTNAFTYQRFLIPYFMGFQGRAIFLDGADMLMLGDIAELDKLWGEQLLASFPGLCSLSLSLSLSLSSAVSVLSVG